MKLTPKQVQAIPLLLSGETGRKVAETIGVTPQTISEWHKDLAFSAHLNALKWEILESTLDYLRALARKAAKTYGDILESCENDGIRRKAALDILELVGIKNPQSGTARPCNAHGASVNTRPQTTS